MESHWAAPCTLLGRTTGSTYIYIICSRVCQSSQAVRIIGDTCHCGRCSLTRNILIIIGDINIPSRLFTTSNPADGGTGCGNAGSGHTCGLKTRGALLEGKVVDEQVVLVVRCMLQGHVFCTGWVVGREALVVCCSIGNLVTPREAGELVVGGGVTHAEGLRAVLILLVEELHVQAVLNARQLGRYESLVGQLIVSIRRIEEEEESVAGSCILYTGCAHGGVHI